MKKIYYLWALLPLFAFAGMQAENVLTKNCLQNYKNKYLTKKEHKAFVYAREKDTYKDRCNWGYGYDTEEEAIKSAMKGCQSVMLNAECMLVDLNGEFKVADGTFQALKPMDDTPLNEEEIKKFKQEAKGLILGNCLPFFEKFLQAKGHKSFAYSVDRNGHYACGYSYQNQAEVISQKRAIKSCEDNKKKRGKKKPTSECKVYMTNKEVLLKAEDYGIAVQPKNLNPLTPEMYESELQKAKGVIESWVCLIQYKYYLKSGQNNAYYLAKGSNGKEACGRDEDAFTLDVAKTKAKEKCEKNAKEQKVSSPCKLVSENWNFVGTSDDFTSAKETTAVPVKHTEKQEPKKVVENKVSKNVDKGQKKQDMNTPLPLEETLQITAQTLNKDLPTMVDSELRLDKVTSDKHKMHFHYTLVYFTNNDMPAERLHSLMFEDIKTQICADKESQMLLKKGMALDYNYIGKDKQPITTFSFDAKVCGMQTNVERLKSNILNLIKK